MGFQLVGLWDVLGIRCIIEYMHYRCGRTLQKVGKILNGGSWEEVDLVS